MASGVKFLSSEHKFNTKTNKIKLKLENIKMEKISTEKLYSLCNRYQWFTSGSITSTEYYKEIVNLFGKESLK